MDDDVIKFKSGRVLSSKCDFFGIAEDLSISRGCYCSLDVYPSSYTDWHGVENISDYTDIHEDDLIEFADHVIDRWERFKEKIKKEG